MQFITKLFERECEMALRFYIFMGKNLSKLLRDISALSQKELELSQIPEEKQNKFVDNDSNETEKQEKTFHTIFSLGEEEVLLRRRFFFFL